MLSPEIQSNDCMARAKPFAAAAAQKFSFDLLNSAGVPL
jgi:hypothetical protein